MKPVNKVGLSFMLAIMFVLLLLDVFPPPRPLKTEDALYLLLVFIMGAIIFIIPD